MICSVCGKDENRNKMVGLNGKWMCVCPCFDKQIEKMGSLIKKMIGQSK